MDHSRNAVSERRAPNPPGTIAAPLCVGSLDAEGDRITGLISISTGALPPAVQMMIGERFKVIAMGGNRLKHRRTLLHRIWLEMTMDEDDTPATHRHQRIAPLHSQTRSSTTLTPAWSRKAATWRAMS